jgi:hypothetical protein
MIGGGQAYDFPGDIHTPIITVTLTLGITGRIIVTIHGAIGMATMMVTGMDTMIEIIIPIIMTILIITIHMMAQYGLMDIVLRLLLTVRLENVELEIHLLENMKQK